ncbi:MAG: DUF2779 domain-containing protein, partial [Gammaproteobacteria bacterium]|nr:DUF2779 domain-containing protein [Gammaproteobacteria bacterium]
APELTYEALGEVQDGTQAQQAFLKVYASNLTANERNNLVKDMKAYCALDTLAMVKILQRLGSA